MNINNHGKYNNYDNIYQHSKKYYDPTYKDYNQDFNNKRFPVTYCPTNYQNKLYSSTGLVRDLLKPYQATDKMISQAMDIALTEETYKPGDIFSVFDLDTIDDYIINKLINRTVRILKDEIGEAERLEYFVQNNSKKNELMTLDSFGNNTAKDDAIFRKYRRRMTWNFVNTAAPTGQKLN